MLVRMFSSVLLLVTMLVHGSVRADIPNLAGNYYMVMPDDGNQYVFNIDWSSTLNQYLVTVTGQSLAWAMARVTINSDTSITMLCDNGVTLTGAVSYSTDLPTICWPAFKDFTCWKHLLSNVTRIHVINM